MCVTDLSEPWQLVAGEMLNAWRHASFPIGAIIFDENWEIVARGRNTIHNCAQSQPISCHELAHAEINALWQVSKFRHEKIEGYSLLTSLEPCMLCFGAFVMSRIANLEFGARDEFAGATTARDEHGYTDRRAKIVGGPNREIETIQLVLLSEFIGRRLPHDVPRILPSWSKTSSVAVKVGIELAHDGTLFSSAVNLTDENIWDVVQHRLDRAEDRDALAVSGFGGSLH